MAQGLLPLAYSHGKLVKLRSSQSLGSSSRSQHPPQAKTCILRAGSQCLLQAASMLSFAGWSTSMIAIRPLGHLCIGPPILMHGQRLLSYCLNAFCCMLATAILASKLLQHGDRGSSTCSSSLVENALGFGKSSCSLGRVLAVR